MQKSKKSLFIAFSTVVALITATPFAQKPVFEKKLSASGQSEAVFNVEKWGRYAITVQSPEGSALKLIDRKVGVRQKNGLVGERNGRIDDFFDFGEYKIIASSHEKGTVSPKLKVFPFKELNRNAPRYLTADREYKESLEDLEQLSYWIHLEKTETIFLEVLGRNVADVQLWQDGQWRVDAKRTSISSRPMETTPLKGYRVVQKLKPGYYMLSIYGGPVADWSENSDEHPVYFRWKLPRFPATGTGAFTISETGYNQFLIPSSTRNVVLTAPDKKEKLYLSRKKYRKTSPVLSTTQTDSIHTKSREPRCVISSGSESNIIRVTGKPGRQFTLKTFEGLKSSLYAKKTASYWISTQHTGYPEDQIGVTGGIVERRKRDIEIVKTSVDTVGADRKIERSFNLLDDVSLVFWADNYGKYEFISGGVQMEMSIHRFLAESSRKVLKKSRKKMTVTLEKGFYILKLDPLRKGVGKLEVKSNSFVGKARKMAGLQSQTETPEPNAQFPSVRLEKGHRYGFFLNSLQPEFAGLIMRKLPLDLTESLPVCLRPGKPVSVEIEVKEKSDLYFTDERGNHFSFKIDGKKRESPARVKKGSYELIFERDSLVCLHAKTVPLNHLPSAKPRPFPTGKSSPLQIFPELKAGEPVFIDMERNDYKVYEFNVEIPGIYRFETTGRLRTSLTLRDRFIVKTHHKEANGIGRNALIQAYLLPGRYQTRVQTEGRSAGRLSLSLKKNRMINGGKLTLGREKRHPVPIGVGIQYQVHVSHDGAYHLIAQGQSGYYNSRLEDSEGWPIRSPGEKGDIEMPLKKGDYKLISLPLKRRTTRIARLTEIEKPQQFKGKGPHIISLNETARSVWMEDSSAKGRRPAKYVVRIPAPVRCKFSCTKGFDVEVLKDSTHFLSFEGVVDTLLPMGTYTLEIMSKKPQNYADYQVNVSTSMLVSGLSYSFPSHNSRKEFTVSVGRKTVVELFSQGMRDVAATLRLKDSDSVVAFNDDATKNWNFKISRVLEPAFYRLTVENRGSSSGKCEISMSSLSDTLHDEWPMNKTQSVDLDGKIHTFPVVLDKKTDIVNLEIHGGSRTGSVIERKLKSGEFVPAGEREGDTVSLSVRVNPQNKYRLRVWSADHLNEKVNLSVNTARLQNVSINDLLKGEKLKTSTNGLFSNAYLQIDMGKDSLNHFRVTESRNLSAVRTLVKTNKGFERDYEDYISILRKNVCAEFQFLKQGSHYVKIAPVRVDTSLYLPVTYNPRAFACDNPDKGASVFSAEMKNGTPMCGVYSRKRGDFYPGTVPVWAGAFQSRRKAVSVALPGDPHRFLVWNADVKSAKTENHVSVQRREYKLLKQSRLELGNTEWEPSSPGMKVFEFSKSGPAMIDVTVPRGGIAVWKRKDGTRKVFSTDERFASFTLLEKEGELYCINTAETGYFHVQCIAVENQRENTRELKTDARPVEYKSNRAGSTRVPIKATFKDLSKRKLFLHGPVDRVDWWTENGMYVRGIEEYESFPVMDVPGTSENTAGFLDLKHGNGMVVVNLPLKKSPNLSWGPDLKTDTKKRITHQQVMKLENGKNWFAITAKNPTHVQVSADADCAGILRKNDKTLKTYVGTGEFEADIPLEKGTYVFGLRSLGNAPLEHSSVTVSYREIEHLTESQPPLVRLTSGESRILRFKLSEKRTIGIGLDTDKEVWQAQLYTDDFDLVGKGQQMYQSLEKGTYYLRLSIPHYQKSAECVVRLVGQNVPSEQPPENVIRKYIHH
ncbi:MAG: hypothetical protein ACLFQB_00950 [Chitinispirillaceae bacterium]